jgi:cell division protein FtsN
MRRSISFLLIVSILATTWPAAEPARADATRPEEGAPRVAKKRDGKGMLLWGTLMVANAALLSLGLRDLEHYKDRGSEAEARGEDPSGYWDSYDRAGWIVAGAGAALLASGVGFARASRLRPAYDETPLARAAAIETPLRVDPVEVAIAGIERGDARVVSADSSAQILSQRTTMTQAWVPGTVVALPNPVPESSPVPAPPAAPEPVATTAPPVAPPPPAAPAASDGAVAEVVAQAPLPVDAAPVARTETPAAAPAPSATQASPPPAASPDASRYFTVQVSSHKKASSAEQEAARWTALGYPAEVVAKDLNEKGVWHRVVMGSFARSSDAQDLAASIRRRFPAHEIAVVRR